MLNSQKESHHARQSTLLILGHPRILFGVCDKPTPKIFYPLVKTSFYELVQLKPTFAWLW